MADNSVFITGAADGAFTEALSGLPPWATESTLFKIQGILEKTLQVQNKMLAEAAKKFGGKGSNNPETTKKYNDELEEAVKNLAKENSENTKKKKERKEEEDHFKKKKKHWEDQLAVWTEIRGRIVAFGAAIQNTFKENFDTYTKLNAEGINLVANLQSASDGFNSLQQITALTGVRYTELAASMTKYNAAVNAFSAGKFAKTVGLATKNLLQFGFSSKESADLLGAYLDTQMGYTDVSKKSVLQVSSELVGFGDRINKLSLATGMARAAILANLDALAKSNEASVLQGQVGEKAAESTLEFVSSLKNQNFGKSLLKMMTDVVKPLNETSMTLQKLGQGGFAQKMQAFVRSLDGLSPQQQAQALKEFERRNHAEIEANKQQANFYSQVPELAGEANKALEMYAGLQQSARAVTELNEKDLKKLESTNKARAALATQWETLLSKLQQAFAPTAPMIEMFANGLEWLNKKIDAFINLFSDQTRSWVGIGIVIGTFFAGMKILGSIVRVASKNFGLIAEKGSKAPGLISRLFGGLGRLLPIVGRLLGVAGLLYAAFEVGQAIGEQIYGVVSNFNWFNDMMDSLFKGIDDITAGLLDTLSSFWKGLIQIKDYFMKTFSEIGDGYANIASWISGKIKEVIGLIPDSVKSIFSEFTNIVNDIGDAFKQLIGRVVGKFIPDFAKGWFGSGENKSPASSVTNTKISESKSSTVSSNNVTIIKSPSQTNVVSPKTIAEQPDTQSVKAVKIPESSSAAGTGIEKSSSDVNINTALNYQNSLMEQLLHSINSMASTSKDILKYTRAQV
jgi:hypothetical protein